MKIKILPERMKKLDFSRIAPYNDKDLVYFLSPNLSVVLKRIQSIEDNTQLSIKNIMESEEYKTVFACNDFEKRLQAFAEKMDTKLERKFVTKKSQYVFFDEEEQDCLKQLFREVPTTCVVSIQRRRKDTKAFVVCPLQQMLERDFLNIRDKLEKEGIVVEISLSDYMRYTKKFHTFKGTRVDKEKETLENIFKEFPNLKAETQKNIKKAYKDYAKQYHPDINNSEEAKDKTALLNELYNELQETKWYKSLREE